MMRNYECYVCGKTTICDALKMFDGNLTVIGRCEKEFGGCGFEYYGYWKERAKKHKELRRNE